MFHAARSTKDNLCQVGSRWLLSTVVMALVLALSGVRAFADEKTDSGWVVAKPVVVSDEVSADGVEAEIVFGKDTEPGEVPPPSSSQESSPRTSQAKQSETTPGELRVAARSTKSSGWRSVRGSNNQAAADSGPAPPPPTQTSPAFLLPTTQASDNTGKQTSEQPKSKVVEKPSDEPPVEKVEVADEADASSKADESVASVEADEHELEILESDELEVEDPLPPLTKEMMQLRYKLRRVLKSYYRQPLNSRDNDPWEVMHGMLAFGIHSRVKKDGPRGEPITSVGWLSYNKPCKWQTLMYVSPQGDLRAKYGVGLQGHMGQFLAMLAQCKVSPDYPIRVEKHTFTVQDLIQAEMDTCYSKTELTFKLIALMHYLESDATWINDQGQEWSISRLVKEEMAQPIRSAACGGTHRLAGLSLAARTRVKRGEPLDGEFERAAEYVKKYHEYAFRFQNRDGSLSTNWFRGRGDERDINRRVKTTGHTLEWLCYSLEDDELTDWRSFRAINYLTNLLYSNYNNEWEVGPLCHALHALILYDERVFQPYDEKLNIATRGSRNSASRNNRTMPAWMR
jgi:hypothetical protein